MDNSGKRVDDVRSEDDPLRVRVDELTKMAESVREGVAEIEARLFGSSPVEAPEPNPSCPAECLEFMVLDARRTLLRTRNLAAHILNRL